MTSNKLEYYHIAEIQVETAIDLFNAGNLICAITLAGAGEEILGKLLPEDKEKAVDRMAKTFAVNTPELTHKQIKDNYLNIVRNGFKHIIEDICDQDINLRMHAIQYIGRACLNYFSLKNNLTKKMIAFSEAHPPEYFDDAEEKKS